MRIILEMTEAEQRWISIERRELSGETGTAAGTGGLVQEAGSRAAESAGGPSPALLMALGEVDEVAEPEPVAEGGPDGGTSAGGPPAWLVDLIWDGDPDRAGA
jgi:hypothetical protein